MLPALSEAIALPPGTAARVVHVTQPADSPVPDRFAHFHGVAELVLIHQGSGTFITETGEHRFGPRMLLFVPTMAIHDFAFDPGARNWTLVQFDALAADPDQRLLPRQAVSAALNPESLCRARTMVDWLSDGIGSTLAPAEVEILLKALLLAIKPAMASGTAGTEKPDYPLSRFRPVLQQLMEHPGQHIGLADAATMCAVSAPYFSRLFKQSFGIGFSAYQNQFRLQQAARLLATSDAPTSQIAYRLGFQSHAYFSQRFREMFGASPSQFLKTMRHR